MAKKKTFTEVLGEDAVTDYYDAMRQAKRAAGLSLEQAIEVTARQRAEDEANGVELKIEEPEETPEA